MDLKVGGRIWLETSRGTLAGIGRVTLLERIKKYGSITDAARSMKMSYRQAWEQIELMNKQASSPLVIKLSGGAGGGGSQLTAEGEKLIEAYYELEERFNRFTIEAAAKL